MTYQETIAYLYASQPAFHLVGAPAYKPGLDNTMALMEHLGNPHLSFRSIHVAGTNGKGSTSHLIAASLQAAGLKVGLYTSPHLIDMRERIRINGQMIPQDVVVDWVARERTFLDALKPSFFETVMALAFWYFAQQQVDVAVVEVGLGGRLDSTNILTPVLSVITNIGLDHEEFLGHTLEAIAREKAGIIKQGVACVIGETHPETAPVFICQAQSCAIWGQGLESSDSLFWFADQCGYLQRCRQRDITTCELQGIYQEYNMQTAYVALRYLMRLFPIRTQHIQQGFARVCTMTGLQGRWQQLSSSPVVVCDTGHNSHGIQYVAKQLDALCEQGNRRLLVVFDMVADKDVEQVLSLLPIYGTYLFCTAPTHRAIPAEQMCQLWRTRHGRLAQCQAYASVALALAAAKAMAKPDDVVFIGGSNYVVGEALRLHTWSISRN